MSAVSWFEGGNVWRSPACAGYRPSAVPCGSTPPATKAASRSSAFLLQGLLPACAGFRSLWRMLSGFVIELALSLDSFRLPLANLRSACTDCRYTSGVPLELRSGLRLSAALSACLESSLRLAPVCGFAGVASGPPDSAFAGSSAPLTASENSPSGLRRLLNPLWRLPLRSPSDFHRSFDLSSCL